MRLAFWKKIEINWVLRSERLRVKAILAFFLNHTQGAPFSFSLFREGGHPENKHVRWILKDLLHHSSQWEEVFIRMQPTGFDLDLRFLRNAKIHLPLLQKLEITSSAYFGSVVHPSSGGIFKDAPLLTHVVVRDISEWDLNWSSLTILNVGFQRNTRKSLPILQKTVNLVELTFSDVFLCRHADIMINLPHLGCLSTMNINVLTILETPALRRLEILVNVYWDEAVSYYVKADETVDFLRRSCLKLTFAESSKSEESNYKVVLHTSTF
jgi:hypothetical protein